MQRRLEVVQAALDSLTTERKMLILKSAYAFGLFMVSVLMQNGFPLVGLLPLAAYEYSKAKSLDDEEIT